VAEGRVESFSSELAKRYEQQFGIKCAVYPCVAVYGAVELSLKEKA
jgi:galactokinase